MAQKPFFVFLLLNEREKSPAGKIIDPSCQRLGQPIRAHDLLRLIKLVILT